LDRSQAQGDGFWRAQFFIELARPTGLEPVFPP
jgi:hypothetical protein